MKIKIINTGRTLGVKLIPENSADQRELKQLADPTEQASLKDYVTVNFHSVRKTEILSAYIELE